MYNNHGKLSPTVAHDVAVMNLCQGFICHTAVLVLYEPMATHIQFLKYEYFFPSI